MKSRRNPFPLLLLIAAAGCALIAAVALAFIGKAHAAPVNRVEFIDANAHKAQPADVESAPLGAYDHGLPVITANARTYPYRCTFGGKILPRQRIEAVCFLPRGRAGDLLAPMPIVQVATGSVVVDSTVVAIERNPLRVRVTLTNVSAVLEPLRATVDVY